jgi:hypothetical protein
MSQRIFNSYRPKTVTGDLGYRGRESVNGVIIITPAVLRAATDPVERPS